MAEKRHYTNRKPPKTAGQSQKKVATTEGEMITPFRQTTGSQGAPARKDGKERLLPSVARCRMARALILQRKLTGASDDEIVELLTEQPYGYGATYARTLVSRTMSEHYQQLEDFKADAAAFTLGRLIAIADESWGVDYNATLKSLDMVNKMMGAYQDNLNVNQKSDETIEIKFG